MLGSNPMHSKRCSKNEHILVKLKETDGEDSIWLLQNDLSKSSS